jgi:hypothetical protein
MAYNLEGGKVSATRKRVDGKVALTDFFGNKIEEFDIRIVTRAEMSDSKINEIVEEVIERRAEATLKTEYSEWASLPLKAINGNAYIKIEIENEQV